MPRPTKPAGRPRIAIYRRVSTDRQAEEGVSLDVQLQHCIAEADRVYGEGGYDYTDFCDDGYSGSLGLRSQDRRKTRHRPRLSDMIEAVARGEFDAVFIYRLDRLFRSISLAAHLLKDYFNHHNVGLVSAHERIDASTAHGRVLIYVMATMAEYFVDWMGENITAALRTIRLQGHFIGKVPYGWRPPTEAEIAQGVVGDIFRNDEQGGWVVQMKDWYLAGWGTRRIIEALHDAGVRSPTGNEWWTMAVIRNQLASTAHAGLVSVGDSETVRGLHYDLRYWDEDVRSQIAETARMRSARGSTGLRTPHYLLSEVLWCGHCGGHMRARHHKSGEAYYRCVAPVHRRDKACVSNSKGTSVIEDCVLQAVRELAERPDIQDLARQETARLLRVQDADLDQDTKRLRAEIAQTDAAIDKWGNLYLSQPDMSSELLARKSGELQRRRDELTEQLDHAEERLQLRSLRSEQLEAASRRLRAFPEVWERFNTEEKRELLESVVVRAEMSKLPAGEAALRLHLVIGGEREVVIPKLGGPGPTREALSLQQLALVELAHQGLDREGIAEATGKQPRSVASAEGKIRRKLGVANIDEAYGIVRDAIERNRPWLPLSGRQRAARPDEAGQCLQGTEAQVVALRAEGRHVATIAKRCGVPVGDVQSILSKVQQMIGAPTDREAAESAVREGLLSQDQPPRPRLRPREAAYLFLRREGASDDDIATRWEVDAKLVGRYRKEALQKLGSESVEEAIVLTQDLLGEAPDDLPLGPLPHRSHPRGLSDETLAVLRARSRGLTWKQIADECGIRLPTVQHHFVRARQLLGVDSPDEAVAEAKARGLID